MISLDCMSGCKPIHAYGSYSAGAGAYSVGVKTPLSTTRGTSVQRRVHATALLAGRVFLGAWLFLFAAMGLSLSATFPSLLFPLCFCVHVCFVFFFVGLAAVLESLLVVRELGVQVTTKYVDGREKSTVRQTSDPPLKKRTA